jgi:hypothetical protein
MMDQDQALAAILLQILKVMIEQERQQVKGR